MGQLLLSSIFRVSLEHGGDIARGKRKGRRPLAPKRAIHAVMRSSKAKGELSLRDRRNLKRITRCLKTTAERFHIRLYHFAINASHVHLLIRGRTRRDLQNFFRTLSGIIARLVTGACRGKPAGRFWDKLLYTRIVEWGRAFQHAAAYVHQNLLEAEGLIPYQPRLRARPSRRAGPR